MHIILVYSIYFIGSYPNASKTSKSGALKERKEFRGGARDLGSSKLSKVAKNIFGFQKPTLSLSYFGLLINQDIICQLCEIAFAFATTASAVSGETKQERLPDQRT